MTANTESSETRGTDEQAYGATDAFFAETAHLFGLRDHTPGRYRLWRARLNDDEPQVSLLRSNASSDVHRRNDWSPARLRSPHRSVGCESTSPAAAAGLDRPVDSDGPTVPTHLERVGTALRRSRELSRLNALTEIFEEQATRDADVLDVRLASGQPVGSLAGMLIAVKDMIDVEGHVSSAGTRAYQAPAAERDAPVVSALRNAGAIIFAAANMHALAYGALGTSSDFGEVRNPLRPEALAGGSSSGSAVAVATGLVDAALGSDTGGSIRLPASLCGVVGLKPTYGRVSTEGVLPLGYSLDHVGPIARTTDDVAAVFSALTGEECGLDLIGAHLSGAVVGVPKHYFMTHLDQEVEAAFEDSCRALEKAGAVIREVHIPSAHLSPGAMTCTLGPEALSVHSDLLIRRGHRLPEDVRTRLETCIFRSASDYVLAQQVRARLRAEVDDALDEVDLLLTPSVPILAPHADAKEVVLDDVTWSLQHALTRLTMPFNLTGHPAISVPWTGDSLGGSIGIQFIARRMGERNLLKAAASIEKCRPVSSSAV